VNTASTAQTVTLANSGNAGLAVTRIAITGSNAGDYAEVNNCGATLAVNVSCQISVTFTPTAQGTRTAALTVSDNAPGSPQSVPLTGVTTPKPALTLTPTSIIFPGQYVGTAGFPQTVTATNTGDAPLTITNVTTTSTDFGVVNACGGSLECSLIQPLVVKERNADDCGQRQRQSPNRASTPVTVSVTTLGNSAASARPRGPSRPDPQIPIYFAICGLPGLLGYSRYELRKRRTGAIWRMALLGIVCLVTAGCGGSSSTGGGGTPANTYTLTATGTYASGSANLTHSMNLTLVVQ
jgi:hypothetical protein